MVVRELRKNNTPDVKSDPDYTVYLEFKAWKESQGKTIAPVHVEEVGAAPLSADEQKAILLELAAENNVKVDKRWGLDKIKDALDKAGEAA
jgi:hypothetical protein